MANEFTGDNEFFGEVIDCNMESGFNGADCQAEEEKGDPEFEMISPDDDRYWDMG